MLLLFERVMRSSPISLEDIKFNCYCQLDFLSARFLKSNAIGFRYGLILIRYSLSDGFLFPSTLLSYFI